MCDLCLVIGTSSVVYPAAMFAPQVAERGVPVAEFNLEKTPATHSFGWGTYTHFTQVQCTELEGREWKEVFLYRLMINAVYHLSSIDRENFLPFSSF